MSTNKKTQIAVLTLCTALFSQSVVVLEDGRGASFDGEGLATVDPEVALALLNSDFKVGEQPGYQLATGEDEELLAQIKAQVVQVAGEAHDLGPAVRLEIPCMASSPLVAPDGVELQFDEFGAVLCGSQTAEALRQSFAASKSHAAELVTITPLNPTEGEKVQSAAEAARVAQEALRAEAEKKAQAKALAAAPRETQAQKRIREKAEHAARAKAEKNAAKAKQEEAEQEKAEQEKAEQEKAEQEKAEQEKAEQEPDTVADTATSEESTSESTPADGTASNVDASNVDTSNVDASASEDTAQTAAENK